MSDRTAPVPFEEAHTSRFVIEALSPAEALALAKKELGQTVFILVQTPREARFLRLADEIVQCEAGEEFRLAKAFEIRFFSATGELSWRRTGSAGGRAMLTLDKSEGTPGPEWSPVEKPAFSREGQRLLWGATPEQKETKGAQLPSPAPGWSQLFSPRVGAIHVPVSAPGEGGRRAFLQVVEYARIAEDGNVIPAGERLKGFGWLNEGRQS
jgi:CRISPR-associated protein (TIGR03984 family)